MVEKSDKELISICKTSDKHSQKEAFTILMRRYEEKIRWYISQKLRYSDVSEDILQDFWIRIWNEIRSNYIEQNSFSSWLYTIARNLCFDYLRKINQEARSFKCMRDSIDPALSANPDSDIEVSDTIEYILQCVESELGKECLRIGELLLKKNKTPKEIADALSIPLQTVYERLHKLKKLQQSHKLKEVIQE